MNLSLFLLLIKANGKEEFTLSKLADHPDGINTSVLDPEGAYTPEAVEFNLYINSVSVPFTPCTGVTTALDGPIAEN